MFLFAFSWLLPSQLSKICATINSFLRNYKIFPNKLNNFHFFLSSYSPVHLFLFLITAFFPNSLLPALLCLIKSILLFICLCPWVQLIHPLVSGPFSHLSINHHFHSLLASLSLSLLFFFPTWFLQVLVSYQHHLLYKVTKGFCVLK